jgi:hypothetical protein
MHTIDAMESNHYRARMLADLAEEDARLSKKQCRESGAAREATLPKGGDVSGIV